MSVDVLCRIHRTVVATIDNDLIHWRSRLDRAEVDTPEWRDARDQQWWAETPIDRVTDVRPFCPRCTDRVLTLSLAVVMTARANHSTIRV